MFKKLWEYSGWIVGIYSIYSHIKTLDMVRSELYTSLSPEQQRRLDEIVGKVKAEAQSSLSLIQPNPVVPIPQPSITSLQAGV